MTCHDLQGWLRIWDLSDDLSDSAALHLDDCPECLAHFNMAFLPVSPPSHPAPLTLRPSRPSLGFRSIATLAAAALLLSVMPGRTADAATELEECEDYHRTELSYSVREDMPEYCDLLE